MKIWIATVMLCAPWMAEAAEVRLLDTIAVRAPSVELGEIATIEGCDAAKREILSKIVIGPAPTIGSSRTISAYRVKALLQKEGYGDISVLGLKSSVSTESKALTEDELKGVIEGWVMAQKKDGEEIQLHITRTPQGWVVPAADDLKLVVELGNQVLAGSISLTIRAVAENETLSSQRAQVSVRRYREVPVMVRPLQSGELLTPDHLSMEKTEVTQSNGMEVMDVKSMIGMVAKRNLTMGTRPKVTDFERPLLIERGQSSQIIVENGSVRMKVSGAVALQGGREGDIVMFSNPMNERETLKARVSGRGVAVLKLN